MHTTGPNPTCVVWCDFDVSITRDIPKSNQNECNEKEQYQKL